MTRDGQLKIYEIVTERMVKALEAGTVPWHQPWRSPAAGAGGWPRKLSSGKNYRGVNVWLLGLVALTEGYSSTYWGTIKRINELGGQVRKGESPTLVTFWKSFTKTEEDEETGKPKKVKIFYLRYHKVFNADQAEGLPERYYAKPEPEAVPAGLAHERIESAEKIFAAYLAENPGLTYHERGDKAFYRPSTDELTVPALEDHDSANAYYSTKFHETTHSTGHETRCNRPGVAKIDHFGSEKYSKEELVAEMGASILCAVAGIDGDFENSAAYIGHWLKVLKGDPKLVVQASAQAQRAVDFVLGEKFEESD
jgi:antirestriction protein ArdC